MNDLQQAMADLIRQVFPCDFLGRTAVESLDDQDREALQSLFIQAIASTIIEEFDVRWKNNGDAEVKKPRPASSCHDWIGNVVFSSATSVEETPLGYEYTICYRGNEWKDSLYRIADYCPASPSSD